MGVVIDLSQICVIPATRILAEDYGLAGATFEDPVETGRVWTVQRLYAPVRGRRISGIRARVTDPKGFFTFVNQRDLELLTDNAKPGSWCHWLGDVYPYVNDEESGWLGLCCDSDDLMDELHEYETLVRQQYYYHYNTPCIPTGIEYTRRIHREKGSDLEELLLFLGDKDPETGYAPDGRLETLERRWSSVERRKVVWDRV